MTDVIIIGGGAAGMLAGVFLARAGKDVTIIEKNEKLGKKLYITGKGRCNVTNACATEEIFDSIISNKRFMYSSINSFTNYDVMGFFGELGLGLKVERGDRVFPESDKSSDVINAMVKELNNYGVSILYNTCVKDIIIENDKIAGVITDDNRKYFSKCILVATGGLSYPSTGSTGDGYRFARKAGHSITPTSPALVPFNVKEEYIKDLMGLSLKNVSAKIMLDKKCLYEDFGEMLFTHFGVSGPIVISASSKLTDYIRDNELKMYIDLKPALSVEQLDARLLRDFAEMMNKSFKNSLDGLLPKKLIGVVIALSGINPDKKINSVSKDERMKLVNCIKAFPCTLISLRSYNEAIITQGGIDTKEINPKTMESKRVKNLYFAGEVLDVDALTGGFNLQIAFSTAYAAAMGIINSNDE